MSKPHGSIFHHRYYRYVRMMLRRYPKMRKELFSLDGGPGIDALCGGSLLDRLKAKAANK